MRRKITPQNFLLFTSSFLFIFVLAVFINVGINGFLLRVGDGVISSLEKNFNVRISYGQIHITGPDSLRIRDIVIRRSDFHDPAVLLTVRELKVKFNFFRFIFTSTMEEECLRGLDASGVVYNHFPAREVVDGVKLPPVVIKRPSTGPKLDPRDLRFDIRILDGWARLYGSAYDPGRRQSPLFQAQIQQGFFRINDGRVKVNFNSRTGLVEEGFFSTRLDVKGDVDLMRGNGDLLFAFHDSIFAGAGMPDIRFFASLRDGDLTVDSAPFKQAIRLQGAYRKDGSGSLSLGFSEESRFFIAFLGRYFPGGLGTMFVRPGEKYSPEGKIVLNFDKNSLRLNGDLAIRAPGGKRIFDFQCSGDEKQLFINRLRLARLSRLIEFQGAWRYTDALPRLRGVIRSVALGGHVVSTTVHVDRPAEGRYLLRLGGVSVNGAPLGSFGAYLSPKKNGLFVDTAGMAQGLQVKGHIADGSNLDLAVGLQGYTMGVLARAFGTSPFWEERVVAGNARVLVEKGYLKSSGALSARDPRIPEKRVELSYQYEKGRFLLHRATLPELGITLSGHFDTEKDGLKAAFVLDHHGRRFTGYGTLRDRGGKKQLALSIPGKLALTGELRGSGVFSRFRITGFPLVGFGVDAALSGGGSVALQQGVVYSKGSLSVAGPAFENMQVKKLTLNYSVTGKDIKVKKIVVDGVSRRVEGHGAFSFTRFGLSGSMNLGDTISAYLNVDSGRLDGRIVFKGSRLLGFIGQGFKGVLDGDILFSGKPSLPGVSCNLKLRDGALDGVPLSGFIRSAQVPQGIRLASGRIRYGDFIIDLGQGSVVQSVPGVFAMSLAARVRFLSKFAGVSSRVQLEGSFDEDQADARMVLGGVTVNNRSFGTMRSRLQFGKARINIVRKSATGLSGFYDIAQSAFSFKLYSDSRLVLDAAGETKKGRMDYFVKSDRLPLAALNFFPAIFSDASGEGRMQLHIAGDPADLQIKGFLQATNGAFSVAALQSPLQNAGMDIRFSGHKIRVNSITGLVGGESISLDGGCYFRKNRIEDLSFRFQTGRNDGVPVNLDLSGLKIRGRVYADLFLKGDPGAPALQGRVAVRDADINFLGSTSSGDGVKTEGVVDRMHWHVDFTALDRVNYINPLVTVVIKQQSKIGLRNRMADSDFTIKGRLTAAQGTLDYLSHQFKIESPTYLEFKQVSGGYDPWLIFKGSTAMRDGDQEPITVYIAYNGSLSGSFKPYFYSEPVKTEDEILVLLGVQPSTPETGKLKTEQEILYKSTDLLATIGLQPFARMVRKGVGLDMFTIRTSVVRYFLERESLDSMDPKRQLNILRDTQFTFGKYLTSFLFLEYTLTLREDPEMPGDLVPAHQVGLEITFSPFNLGYSLRQTEKSGYSEYEQNIEIRFRKRF